MTRSKRKTSTHHKRAQDAHAAREAGKYAHPIPSREFIIAHIQARSEPPGYAELLTELELETEQDREALRRRLNAMERDGQLLRNRRSAYILVNREDLIAGRIVGHADGFGFLIPDAGGEDLFLSPRYMRSVLHGDRAVARVTGIDRRGRREGAVVEVLERGNKLVVGRFHRENGVSFVIPDNKRINREILVPAEHEGGARAGQIVTVEILAQPQEHVQPVGKIVEVLGDHMAPGMEIDVAIRAHEVPLTWPAAVDEEIAGLGAEVPEEVKRERIDLRELPFVTIDGADARDFDDAVYCERKPKGYRLIVAIADVAWYVRPGTALDAEAYARGNSVYFPKRVLPMLPEALSNGLCSLNPNVDRLCLCCDLYIDSAGKLLRSRFFEGVLRSAQRFTYDTVAGILVEQDPALRERHKDLLPQLTSLYALYQLMRKEREQRGAIDFDTTETSIVFGADKKIERIVALVRNDAHRLIEECMIAANIAAARFLQKHKLPGLYRVHAGPKAEKLADLRGFLGELGLRLNGGKTPAAQHYAQLLDKVRTRPDAHLIQTVLLRSLAQATYSPRNIGHFGLALTAYAHFTSPIRRYPDLLVHRAIRHILTGGTRADYFSTEADLALIGDHCSMTERRADEATRDAVNWLKCEYMLDKVGENFSGTISSATAFGIFVELDEIYVEGLVHVTSLPSEYYHFDAAGHRLRGERTGKTYQLGDRIDVKVVRVNLDDRKIDLELAGAVKSNSPPATPKHGKRKKKAAGKGRR